MAVKIEGLDELVKALGAFADEAMPKMNSASDKAADIVLTKAKAKVSVLSGKLRDSLRKSNYKARNGKYIAIKNITWGSDVRDYAAPLELGHGLVFFGTPTGKRVQAKPFLRPAADESEQQVFDELVGSMNKALEEMGGKR